MHDRVHGYDKVVHVSLKSLKKPLEAGLKDYDVPAEYMHFPGKPKARSAEEDSAQEMPPGHLI